MANVNNSEESHVQAKLFTKLKKFDFGDTQLSLPIATGCPQLNALLKGLLFLDQTDQSIEKTQFDFLISGEFLRSTLLDYITEKGLSTEAVIDIEYIVREDTPLLDLSLQHDDWVSAVDLDNGLIVTGSYDNTAYLWDLHGKCLSAAAGHTKVVKSVVWTSFFKDESKRSFLSASQDQTILMWEFSLETNKATCSHVCRGHAASVDCLSVRNSVNKFASGSWDKMIKIWDTTINNNEVSQNDDDEEENETKKKKQGSDKSKITNRLPLASLSGHKEPVSSLVWNEDNELISAGWDHCIRLWDIEGSTNKHTLTGNKAILGISYSNLNQLVASGSADKFVRLWDPRVADGVVVKSSMSVHGGWVSSVKWSETNEYQLASASYDETVKILDTRNTNSSLYDLGNHTDKVMCLCWKDSLVISGGADSNVHVYKSQVASLEASEE